MGWEARWEGEGGFKWGLLWYYGRRRTEKGYPNKQMIEPDIKEVNVLWEFAFDSLLSSLDTY